MPLYKCQWADGAVSFVIAKNKAQAISDLMEVGAANPSEVTVVKDFLVTFTPCVEVGDEGRECFWEIGELGECMRHVLPDVEASMHLQESAGQPHEDAGCAGCPSYDPATNGCGAKPGVNGKAADFETPIRMASFGEMPIPPEEQEGLSQVLEILCHQIANGGLPAANQLVAIVNADHPTGARGIVLHRDDVKAKGGTPKFSLVFVESALGLSASELDSLLVMVSTSNGIGSFVVSTTEVIRSTRELSNKLSKAPTFFRTRGSSAVN